MGGKHISNVVMRAVAHSLFLVMSAVLVSFFFLHKKVATLVFIILVLIKPSVLTKQMDKQE